MSEEQKRKPIAVGILDFLFNAKIKGQTAGSHKRMLSDISGALRLLPCYCNTTTGMALTLAPQWKMTVKGLRRRADTEAATNTEALTLEEFERVKNDPTLPTHARMMLMLCWRSTTRPSDAQQLQPTEVEFPSDNQMKIRFRRGKGVCFRGRYVVLCKVPTSEVAELRRFCGEQANADRLFEAGTTDTLRDALRERLHNERFSILSVRRGATRHLARSMTAEQLMLLTGHTRRQTLHEYLQGTPTADQTRATSTGT